MSDETFTDENFTPDEGALIRRLREAESPRLAPKVYDAIHAAVLAEVDQMGTQPRRTSQPRLIRLAVMVASAAAAALILFVIFVNLRGGVPIIGATETVTQVVQQSSATASPSAESDIASATPSPTDTVSPILPTTEITPTSTLTVVTIAPTVAGSTATFTPMPVTDTPTPTLETVVVLAGVIQQIDGGTLTVNGVLVHVPPSYPILELVEVGDVVRVQGVQDENGGIVASLINNVTDSEVEDATVTMDGPLESLDEDRDGAEVAGVVNGIDVLFDADEPLLETIVIGDFLSIQGNFELRDGQFVLVVIEVTLVENVPGGTPSNCWYHDDAMGMGHWHCDGMGAPSGMSGMGGMGMEN